MPRTNVFLVTDDHEMIDKAKNHFGPMGVSVHVLSPTQWKDNLDNPSFRHQLMSGVPVLSGGVAEKKGNVLPFPGMGHQQNSNANSKVSTMNELESKAIENAIHQYRGNLTEAAKALGIGRATLYRKVKQYQIDPANARKKRAA
jgi:DNA-binding NtrC family response regulator